MEAEGEAGEETPWTFMREIVPSTNPFKASEHRPRTSGSATGTRAVSRGSRQSRQNKHKQELEKLETELLTLFSEICPPYTVSISEDDCLTASNQAEKADKRRVAAAAELFSEISAPQGIIFLCVFLI